MSNNDPTPKDMLREYRRQSTDFMRNQARLFGLGLNMTERVELLFYMLLHTNAGMQSLHARIAPEEAVTQSMEAVKTEAH